MFRIPRPYLRFIDEPGEEGGGGTDTVDTPTDDYSDVDFSQFGVSEATDTSPTSTDIPSAEAPTEKTPDVWAPVLEALPDDATRAMIRPHLAEWEKNTTQRFQQIHQQYAPWKTFQDAGMTPQDIQMRLAIVQQIDQDPVSFYEKLKGVLVQQGRLQEAAQVQGEIDKAKDEVEVDPIEALTQRQEEFFQQVEQRRIADEQREIARQADLQTETELQGLRDKYKMSPALERELITRAVAKNQLTGRYVPLQDVWNELQAFIAESRRVSPGQRAPRVVPSGGGLPVPQTLPNSQLTAEQRMAKAEAVIERMRSDS